MANLAMVVFALYNFVNCLPSSAERIHVTPPYDGFRYCPEGVCNEELKFGGGSPGL